MMFQFRRPPLVPALLHRLAAAVVILLLAVPWASAAPAPTQETAQETAQSAVQGATATVETATTVDGLLITWRESDLSEGGGEVTEVLGLLVPGHMRLDGHTVSSGTSGPQEPGGVDNLSLIFLADPDRFLVIQRQTGEVTEIRARMIELAEATLAQQMDESETMAAQLEATQQQNVLARITAYRHYLTSYNEVYKRELSTDGQLDDQPCQLVSLERERLTSDGSRQRREVSRACTVPATETGTPVWARDLLSRLSRVTDRAVRLRRLTASIERGIAPPVDGDDVNPYAVLDDMPLVRWRLQNGQRMWEWQLLRVARIELTMSIFDPDATATLPAASAGETLWSHHSGPQNIVATRAPMPPVVEEPVVEEPVVEEPVVEEPVVEEPPAVETTVAEPVAEEPVAEEPIAEGPIAEEPTVAEVAAAGEVSSDALAQARAAFESYNREQGQGRLDAVFYQLQRGEVRITASRPGRGSNKTYVVLIARPGNDGDWTIREQGVQPTP